MGDDLPSGRTSIRLPPELRAAIDDEAARLGVTVTDLIIEVLESHLAKRSKPRPQKQLSFFD